MISKTGISMNIMARWLNNNYGRQFKEFESNDSIPWYEIPRLSAPEQCTDGAGGAGEVRIKGTQRADNRYRLFTDGYGSTRK